ncbi:hypothetical protein [Amycolatopsis anabasis]|uniref:hypothetical protein n=1 Tax=Amycolatopsis anabasis TaxID=1840409 RepID=UPI00131E1D38|nr:hypothetical protein [Amycolatopsis anabasis]
MRWRNGGLVVFAFFLVACGSPTAPQPRPSTSETPSATETSTPASPEPGRGESTTSRSPVKRTPGALGSPIDYDPTFRQGTLANAETGIREDLARKCPGTGCNVKLAIVYRGVDPDGLDCRVTDFEYARPLRWGATITIVVSNPCSRNKSGPKPPKPGTSSPATTVTTAGDG